VRRPGSVARGLLGWQLAQLLILIAGGLLAFLHARHDADDTARQKVIDMPDARPHFTGTDKNRADPELCCLEL
jgi:hypothetical protein